MSLYVREIDEIGYGKPDVSSRTVADVFRRRHDHVLRDIRVLIEKVERFEERTGNISQSKFGLTDLRILL